MQIGRWNHQSAAGASSRGGRPSRAPERERAYAAPAGAAHTRRPVRRAPEGRGSFARGARGFSGAPRGRSFERPRRGGFGAFGTTQAEISKFINKATIVTEEESVYAPEHAFTDFPVDERLKANIVKKGYELPTPIQDKAIPHILKGEDIVGLAETGTGKTAAFLIPLIDKVVKGMALGRRERVLVMAPTRELAVQIEKELAGFARGLGFRGMIAVGGANINPQISALRHDPSFVVGTPGRLKDLMERKALTLSGFETVVLDEADRMLDMGFIDDMRFILAKMPSPRHTLFFSATMGKDIERLVGDFLTSPVTISVKTRDTSTHVDQDVIRIARGEDKFERLVALLRDRDFTKVLVFVRTKHGAERLAKSLAHSGVSSDSIHGNKSQGQRQRALDGFKAGKVVALVATDVAARGIDVPGVSHVINYDLPSTYEDYVHRIGRTGRASARGKALTFVDA